MCPCSLGSNYFPYRPEMNFAYERDCKSYPDYSYDYNHRLPDYYDYQQYEAPAVPQLPLPLPLPTLPPSTTTASGALQPLQTRTPPPRVPQMGVSAGGHRRTPSTVSNNSTVLLEHEELLYDYNNLNLNVNLNVVDYECDAPSTTSPAAVVPPSPATLSKQELYAGSPKLINRMIHSPLAKSKYAPVARPASLPFEQHALSYQPQQQLQPHQQQQQQQQTAQQQQLAALPGGGNKFRSSLKKYNSSTLNGSISSQQGTPTNPTPPDSLTSDDSSYLSAKEGSIGSQHSRVRFSPEAYLDATSNLPLLGRRMTSPATHAQQQQQQQRRHRHTSSASTPSPSASSSS